MAVAFSNKWYRETCREAGYNPDNLLSQSEIDLAKQVAVNMKKYMDAKKLYEPALHPELNRQIKRLDEKRVEHMLNALFFAEVSTGLGRGFESFLERHLSRKKRNLNR